MRRKSNGALLHKAFYPWKCEISINFFHSLAVCHEQWGGMVMRDFPKSWVALRGFCHFEYKMKPDLAGIFVWICAATFAISLKQERASRGSILQPGAKDAEGEERSACRSCSHCCFILYQWLVHRLTWAVIYRCTALPPYHCYSFFFFQESKEGGIDCVWRGGSEQGTGPGQRFPELLRVCSSSARAWPARWGCEHSKWPWQPMGC